VWADILKYRQPLSIELSYQTIANNGTTLSDPIKQSNSDGNSIIPKIAVSDQNNVYVVRRDDNTGNGDLFFIHANCVLLHSVSHRPTVHIKSEPSSLVTRLYQLS
jgi:hypothetical protein